MTENTSKSALQNAKNRTYLVCTDCGDKANLQTGYCLKYKPNAYQDFLDVGQRLTDEKSRTGVEMAIALERARCACEAPLLDCAHAYNDGRGVKFCDKCKRHFYSNPE